MHTLKLLFLTIACLAELFLILFLMGYAIYVIYKIWQVKYHCGITTADLHKMDFRTREEKKRDFLNDEYRTDYEWSLFGFEEVEVHVMAYKIIHKPYWSCKYRYVVDGKEYFIETSEDAEEDGKEKKPPETQDVYYIKSKPQKAFTQSSYHYTILGNVILLVAIDILELFTKSMKFSFMSYVITIAILIYLLRILNEQNQVS